MFFHANTIKKGQTICQTMTYMPNIIFSCQTTSKKAKFLEFGLKNANLATLLAFLVTVVLLFPPHYELQGASPKRIKPQTEVAQWCSAAGA